MPEPDLAIDCPSCGACIGFDDGAREATCPTCGALVDLVPVYEARAESAARLELLLRRRASQRQLPDLRCGPEPFWFAQTVVEDPPPGYTPDPRSVPFTVSCGHVRRLVFVSAELVADPHLQPNELARLLYSGAEQRLHLARRMGAARRRRRARGLK